MLHQLKILRFPGDGTPKKEPCLLFAHKPRQLWARILQQDADPFVPCLWDFEITGAVLPEKHAATTKTQHLPGEIRHQGGGHGPTTCHTEPFSNHQQSRTSPVPWWLDFSFFQRNPPVTDPPPRTSTRPDQAPESSNSLTESQLENGWGSSDSFPRDELVDENG